MGGQGEEKMVEEKRSLESGEQREEKGKSGKAREGKKDKG